MASASFIKALRKLSTLFFGAQYLDYGSMKQVSVEGEILGDVSAKDAELIHTICQIKFQVVFLRSL